MKQAATDTLEPIKTIYDDYVIPLKDAGVDIISKIPPYTSLKTTLFNQRRRGLNVSKLAFKSPMEVEVPEKFETFVLGDYCDNETRIILFCFDETKDLLMTCNSFYGDGTFHSCPPPFVQLYSIHADASSSSTALNVIPVIYVLMSNKTAESYEIMLNIIKSQIPGFNPAHFMTDYEAASMKAIQNVFPQANIKGCFYHFARALWRKAKEYKITKQQSSKRIVALSTALPFLPSNSVKEGWEYIDNDILNELFDCPGLVKFKQYMEQHWLKSNNFIEKWSIFGTNIRTTNCLEGWHSKINQLVGKKTPNLFKLLTILQRDSKLNVIKMKGGLQQKRSKETIYRDKLIKTTNMMLTDHKIPVGYFLERLAWKGSLFK